MSPAYPRPPDSLRKETQGTAERMVPMTITMEATVRDISEVEMQCCTQDSSYEHSRPERAGPPPDPLQGH
jgi:hypothetical protein